MTHSTPYPRSAPRRWFPLPRPTAPKAIGAMLLVWLLAGCTGPVELTRLNELSCPDCRPVTDIHTESFLRLAADANGACLIHRYRDGKENPARWRAMLAPLAGLLQNSRVHLHLWSGKDPSARERNIARAKALRALYRELGAREPKGSIYAGPRLFLPPYHALCRNRQVNGPALELGEQARFLSGQSAPPVATDAAGEQAGNTLVVTIHREP